MRRVGLIAVLVGVLSSPAAAVASSGPVLAGSVANSTSLSGVTAVAVSGHYAYSTAYWPGQLTVLDISNPAAPTVVGTTAATTSLENGSNVTVSGNNVFVVSKNRNASTTSNDDGSGNSLTRVDVTNPASPTVTGTITSSTALFGSYGIAVSGQFAYVASQGILSGQPTSPDTSYGAFSVVDLTNMTIVGHIDNGLPNGTNYLKHATSVAISGNYAYVTAFYDSRVTVIDISNPTSPTVVTSFRDPTNLPFPADLAVQGHYVYVADQTSLGNQFTVLDVSRPASPTLVSSFNDPLLGGAYRIRVRGDFAYISASSSASVAAVDISNPASPRIAGSLTDTADLNSTTGLDLAGGYVIAASGRQSGQASSNFPPYPTTNTGTISAILLDPAPISVAITPSSEPANPTTQTSASFAFSVNDSVSALRCGLDGSTLTSCTTPTSQNYSGLASGSHTFTVQATDSQGNTATDSYTWTVQGTASPPTHPTPAPSISGAAIQGQTLTASPGTWDGTPAPSVTYQWQRCGQTCANIAGATGATYVVQGADVGSTLVFSETATNSSGTASASSPPTASVTSAPKNVSAPAIGGTANQGAMLAAVKGSWSGSPAPTFAYRWQRCDLGGQNCSAISGATTSTYKSQRADVGATVGLIVTATNSAGSASATAPVTAAIAGAPVLQTAPKITGTPAVGVNLTGSTGTWTGYPAPTFVYRWARCNTHGYACSPIARQTATTYTVTTADVGSTLKIVATASNSAGSVAGVSARTAVVTVGSATSRWLAVLRGASARHPTLKLTIPAGRSRALIRALTVALPKGLRFSASRSSLARGIVVRDAHNRRVAFAAAIRHGRLLLTLRHPTAGLQIVIGGRALTQTGRLSALRSPRRLASERLTVIVTETSSGSVRGRLKLRLV